MLRADTRKPEAGAGVNLYRMAMAVFAGVLVLIVVLAAIDWLLHPHSLAVRNVRFEGEFRHISHAELAAALRESVGGNFLLLDLDAIRRRVEQLPWVYRADVRRLWPRDVSVQFEEQKIVARWRETANAAYQVTGRTSEAGRDSLPPRDHRPDPVSDRAWVNHAGETVRITPAEIPVDMPRLEGPAGTSAHVLEQYQRLAPLLGEHGLVVQRLVLTPRRTWELDLTNGVHLVLDRRDTEHKVDRFARVFARQLAAQVSNIRHVDLRYANGFAVRWRNGVLTPARQSLNDVEREHRIIGYPGCAEEPGQQKAQMEAEGCRDALASIRDRDERGWRGPAQAFSRRRHNREG